LQPILVPRSRYICKNVSNPPWIMRFPSNGMFDMLPAMRGSAITFAQTASRCSRDP